MPKTIPAAGEAMPSISRRSILTGIAVLALPTGAVSAERLIEKQIEALAPASISIDDFLARATPAERIRYHTNALVEAMAEKRPDRLWRTQTDGDGEFILVAARITKEPGE
jgi:hypothetical protein